jgi:hypothetical protein
VTGTLPTLPLTEPEKDIAALLEADKTSHLAAESQALVAQRLFTEQLRDESPKKPGHAR